MQAPYSKLVLITGGTRGGLGFETARQLLSSGHRVILTLRDEAKAKAAIAALVAEQPSAAGRVQWVVMDLMCLASVRSASQELSQKHAMLDVLMVGSAAVPDGLHHAPCMMRSAAHEAENAFPALPCMGMDAWALAFPGHGPFTSYSYPAQGDWSCSLFASAYSLAPNYSLAPPCVFSSMRAWFLLGSSRPKMAMSQRTRPTTCHNSCSHTS